MTYGEVLDYLIEQSGMTRSEVARKAGMGRSQITDLISGRTKEPSLSRAKAIADAFGFKIEDFITLMEKDC